MKHLTLPEIRIKDAWLLRLNVSQHLHKLWAQEGAILADDEHMKKIVKAYQKAWNPKEKIILEAVCKLYGLSFRQNVIDVHIAPWFSAFSDPLVIGVKYTPDEFVDTLSHELLHRLFTDNTNLPYRTNKLLDEWKRLFGDEHDFSTLVHIPVHAGLKYIYLDVLKEPERLERDIKSSKANEKTWGTPYINAWNYVEGHDYKDINRALKQSYKELMVDNETQ